MAELSFDEMLRQLDGGSVTQDAAQGLREVVAACAKTGKAGSFTLTLKITSKNNVIEVAPNVDIKPPRAALNGAIFFADDKGGLHRSNPKQVDLPLRSVPAPPTELRTVKQPD